MVTAPSRTVHRLPRLVIAAPASGHGKTTVATGLMAALRADGLEPAGFKIGPDYIDPGYHALATGRPGRNLDPFLCGEDQLVPLLLHGCRGPDPGRRRGGRGRDGTVRRPDRRRRLGLHRTRGPGDRAPRWCWCSTSPRSSRTAAAWVHGLHTFDPDTRISGVILNKAGSVRHSDEVVAALEATGIPVLGVLPRDAGIEAPSRHLGLVPAAERPEAAAALDRLAGQIAEHVDLTQVLSIAHPAPAARRDRPGRPSRVLPASPADAATRPVVAVAGGRAFTFRYAETDRAAGARPGCEPVVFDPVTDAALPAGTAGIYLGGGFPEVHAAELAGNAAMISVGPAGDRGGGADGGRVRRAAVPVPHGRRRTDGGSHRRRRGHDAAADARLPHRGRRP